MPTPEQLRPMAGQEQKPETLPQAVFKESLRSLIEPQKTIGPQGEEIEKPAEVQNFYLKKAAERAIRNSKADNLSKEAERINDWIAEKAKLVEEGKVEETEYSRLENEALLLNSIISQEFYRQAEELKRSEFAQDLSDFLGAAFYQGKYNAAIENGQIRKDKNIILDVRRVEDRERWLYENVRVIMRRVNVSEPEKQWRPIVDMWRSEFKTAAERTEMDEKTYKEFDMRIRSVMAVCASARAMEYSNGSAQRYLAAITESREDSLNMDVADDWSEYLLHENEEMLAKVLEDPLVERYYRKILDLAGIRMPEVISWQYMGQRLPLDENGEVMIPLLGGSVLREFRRQDGSLNESALLADIEANKRRALARWDQTVDPSAFLRKNRGELVIEGKSLAGYFSDKAPGGYRGGFPALIDDILLPEVSVSDLGNFERSELIGAARLAADAFLAEKYTMWEFCCNSDGKFGVWKPDPTWGGDPFRAILEPSFLTHQVKRMYQGPGSEEILETVDLAFRPRDILDTYPYPRNVNQVTELFLRKIAEGGDLSRLSEGEAKDRAKHFLEDQLPSIKNILGEKWSVFPGDILKNDLSDRLSKELVTTITGGIRCLSGLPGQELTASLSNNGNLNRRIFEFRERINSVLEKNLVVSKARPLRPNALCHLKNYNRLINEALWTFLGGSRGAKISRWDEETIRDLPKILENIDDVYKTDKDLVGLMLARVILAKSLAAVAERAEPNALERITDLVNYANKETRPFDQLELYLWGHRKDGRDGYLAQLIGPRLKIPIGNNRYGAEDVLQKARNVITYTSRRRQGR